MSANEPPASGGPLIPVGGDAAAVKAAAAEARAQLARQLADVKAQQDAARATLEEQRRSMEAEFARVKAELEAQMAPLKAELAKMTEVAWTVDLYLGRDESLQQLRHGAPAPVETPITIRQRVLVMAEESLVLMEGGRTGVDAWSIDRFVDWLLESPAHLDRVLPDAKGVVVMVPTRVESRSGNAWEDAGRNQANQASYWLLRNGENLWLLTVDEALRIGDRLMPLRNEFMDVFEQRTFGGGRLRLQPGSEAWLKAEQAADARRRHYMRIVMVLQGIADRTTVWQPQPPALNFFDLAAHTDGKIRVIQDGDASIQLGDGVEPFAAWQSRLNALLRPGIRVIGNWYDRKFREGERVSPAAAQGLNPEQVYLLEERRDGGFVLRFARTDQVWRRDVPIPDRPGWVYTREQLVTPTRRASAVVLPTDRFVLPYDLVTVPELERYLASREERSNHFLSMVPVLRAALAAKRAEVATEAPFRVLLRDTLIGEGADLAEAEAVLDELVHWWKVANAWSRPLNGEPAHEAKAIRQIAAEYRARTSRTPDEADAMVKAGRRLPGVIAVAQTRSGAWFAYQPSDPADPEPGVWLDVTPIRRDGALGETVRWQKLPQRSVSLLNVAWRTDAWDQYRFAVNPLHYLTGPERAQAVADALADTEPGIPVCVIEYHDPANPERRSLTVYRWSAGTPETTAVVAADSPFGWRNKANPIHGTRYTVTKTRDKVTVTRGRRADREFGQFDPDGSERWGGQPWWPTGETQYESHPYLVWADDAMLDRMADYVSRCRAAYQAEKREREATSNTAYRYVAQVMPLLLALREQQARARFVEDYGDGADDLWPAHLASLKLPAHPVHQRTLWGLVAIALQRGEPVAGRTLAELADVAAAAEYRAPGEWHTTRRDVEKWLATYGDVLVPPLDDGPVGE